MTICVVSYDAGAAETLAQYVLQNCFNYTFVLDGPALKIFERLLGPIKLSNLEEVLPNCNWCLCGSGWQSELEWQALGMARQMGIHAVAVLDHWVNYRERFIRRGIENLPDEIWVTDNYAKTLARNTFPEIKLSQIPNLYIEAIIREIQAQQFVREEDTSTNILYVLEPIRQAWTSNHQPGEFQALNFFIENIHRLHFKLPWSMRLRPHPSDPIGKYDRWIEHNCNLKVELESPSTLAESIAWSDIVAGCQTYAMVVALAAKRQVVCSLPPWAPHCTLPQADIIKLANLL